MGEGVGVPQGGGGRRSQPGDVDEVRALLERCDPPAALTEGARNTERHKALADVAGKTGDDDSR